MMMIRRSQFLLFNSRSKGGVLFINYTFSYIICRYYRIINRYLLNYNIIDRSQGMAHFNEIEDPPLKNLFDRASGTGLAGGDVIRLAAGAPGPDLLRRCLPLFHAASKHRLDKEQEEANIFQYGSSSGSWEYREQLAKFLTDHYQDKVNRCDLILTCGATHGLQIVLASLLAPGAIIFVEEVTYMIALDVFKEYPQLPLVPVLIDDNGLIVEDLKEKVEKYKNSRIWDVNDDKPFWSLLYCIPVFHNPTGVTLKQERCEELVEIARNNQMLIFCDDVYNLLLHRNIKIPPKRLFSYDRPKATLHGGHVISNGSFSKILAPGVRVGWLEAPPRIVSKLRDSGIMRSGGAVNQYMSLVVTSLLELGLQRDHLRFLANTLEGRMNAVLNILELRLINLKEIKFNKPQGGYYIWIKLPNYIDSDKFLKWSEVEHKVTALPGSMFESQPNTFKHHIRIAIAYHPLPILETATNRLCDALIQYCNSTTRL